MSSPSLFSHIDPVAFSIGPFVIYWYGISYIVGILLGWQYGRVLIRRYTNGLTTIDLDDFIIWATLAIIFGGRIGYILLYDFSAVVERPWEMLYFWERGRSFHGGLIAVVIVLVTFCYRRRLDFLSFADILAAAAPIGLFCGRIANFVNAELCGRVTDMPWGVIFPGAGPLPRHPSQLYEALLEGAVLFILLGTLEYSTQLRKTRPGLFAAIFLVGYGSARMVTELYRQPDAHIGFLLGGTTWGQWLSTPLLFLGILLAWHVLSQKKKNPNHSSP